MSSDPWARWQGRLLIGAATLPWGAGLSAAENFNLRLPRLSLLGDYYLSAPADGASVRARASGLRATGGVLLGPRAQPWIGQALPFENRLTGYGQSLGTRAGTNAMAPVQEALGDSAALPYIGVGYAGGSPRSGWSFGADLGLVAQSPGAAPRLAVALGRGKSLDDAVRELRFTPLFKMGASYSF